MQVFYSKRLKLWRFTLYGYVVRIEYRSRLKTFDLVFLPDFNIRPGIAGYIRKIVCRNSDFTALCAIVVKVNDEYILRNERFEDCLKRHLSEMPTCDAIRKASNAESPAQGSAICD